MSASIVPLAPAGLEGVAPGGAQGRRPAAQPVDPVTERDSVPAGRRNDANPAQFWDARG